MPLTLPLYKRLINCYFCFIAILTVAFVLLFPRVSRTWVIADWLINYEGGFVRRGLPGQLCLLLSQRLHISPTLFPVFICLFLYLLFLGAARAVAVRSMPSWWNIALITSPATFAYQVMDLTGGGRKEIFYFATLALFVLLLQSGRLTPILITAYLTLAAVGGILSHESILFYTPYFFAALVIAGFRPLAASKLCIVPFACAIATAALCAMHPGNMRIEASICSSLGQEVNSNKSSNEICGGGGAMSYLAISRDAAREEVSTDMATDHYIPIYGFLAMLAILPAIGAGASLRQTPLFGKFKVLWGTALVSLAGTTLLFIYAVDWGRWIYIHIVSIALLTFFITERTTMEASGIGPRVGNPAPILQVAVGALLFVNATLWTLPHAHGTTSQARFGYIDVVRDLNQRIHRHRQ